MTNCEHQYKLKSRLAHTEFTAIETFICEKCGNKNEIIINDPCGEACSVNWMTDKDPFKTWGGRMNNLTGNIDEKKLYNKVLTMEQMNKIDRKLDENFVSKYDPYCRPIKSDASLKLGELDE